MHECHICKTKGNFKTSMIEGVLHAFCPNCKVWVEAKITWPIRTKMYAHRDKDSNHDLADSLGLPENLRRNFAFALGEVEFDVDIHEDGNVSILAVNGMPLEGEKGVPG